MILIIKHVSIEGPGIIGDFFQETNWQLKTIELENGDKLQRDLCDIEAAIILGGPMNVYEEDKFPFLKAEDVFIKKAIKDEIPILGICLGAQLLAKACGAKVEKAKTEEIGWRKVSLTKQGANDPLFNDIDGSLDVFQWHEDSFELPQQAQLLATAESCRNQAFRFGKNAYGLQFHIEVTPEMIGSWVKKYCHNDEQDKIISNQKMIISAYQNKDTFVKQAKKISLNFSRLIKNRVAV